MAKYGLRGSFRGFTYNGIHSSTLGITRISDGTRFNYNLIPSIKEATMTLEGQSGQLYFGTKYTKRDISVSFVFNHFTDEELLLFKRQCKGTGIHDLIFDEYPYKVYSAKITGQVLLKHLSFTDNGENYYNGEGSLTFTCYFPYAHSRYNWQEEYTLDNIPEWLADEEFYSNQSIGNSGKIGYDLADTAIVGNFEGLSTEVAQVSPQTLILDSGRLYNEDATNNAVIGLSAHQTSPYINYNEWINSSQIPSNTEYGIFENNQITLYNAGDINMPLMIWFTVPEVASNINIQYDTTQKINLVNLVRLNGVSPFKRGRDVYIAIDMINHIIMGYDVNKQPTGRIYNQYLSADSKFFLLPPGESSIQISEQPVSIDFNYLYL